MRRLHQGPRSFLHSSPVRWLSSCTLRRACAATLAALPSIAVAQDAPAPGAVPVEPRVRANTGANPGANAASRDDGERAYAYLAGLAEKGLSEMVVKEARAFLRDRPAHSRCDHVRYRLGVACLELGRPTEAVEALLPVSQQREFEFRGEANLRLARAYLSSGDATRAEPCATRALEWGRDYLHTMALTLRAEVRAARSDWKGARADHEAIVARADDPARVIDARIGIAWCALRSGDAAAGAVAAAALARDPLLPAARADEVRVLAGECALDIGRTQEALGFFASVRDAAWVDAAGRGTGYARAAAGDHAGAAVEFARVAESARDAALASECALRAGIELLAAGDAAAARRALSSARVVATPISRYWRARAELESGDAAAALTTIDETLAKGAPFGPVDDERAEHLWTARGAALEKLGRHDEARAAYERAGSRAGLLAVANAHLSAGRHDEAARVARSLTEELSRSPERAAAWLTLGEACLAAKQYVEGERAFLAAADESDDAARGARARLRAGWCRYLAGDPRAARPLFEAAARGPLDDRDAEEASFLTARAAEAAGAGAEAGALFERHVVEHPRGTHAVEACVRYARLAPDERSIPVLEGLADSGATSEWIEIAGFDLAERLSARGRHEDARRRYEAVVAHGRDAELVTRARYGVAWSAYSLHDLPGAARALEALSGSGDLSPATRLAAADLMLFVRVESGDRDGAVAAWNAWSRLAGPDADRGERARGVFDLLRKGTDPAVARAFAAALAGNATPAVAAWGRLFVARLDVDAGRLDEAELALRALAETATFGTTREETWFALAEARFERGEDARALPAYDRVAESSAAHGSLGQAARYKAGFVRLRSGDAAGAERDFARLVEAAPRGAFAVEARFLRGEALYRLERLDEAIEVLAAVRRDAPGHAVAPKVAFRLGVAACRRARYAEARAVLDDLATRVPEFPAAAEVDLWRGRALTGLGDARSARAAFERAISRGEGRVADESRVEIGRAAASAGDHEGALDQFLKVALLSNSAEVVPEALWCAGEELEALNQPARARDRYREIVADHAQSAFAARARKKLETLDPRRP